MDERTRPSFWGVFGQHCFRSVGYLCGLLAVGVVSALSMACVQVYGQRVVEGSWERAVEAVRPRASFEFSCPSAELRFELLRATRNRRPAEMGVYGCGHRGVYVRRFETNDDWVLNVAIAEAEDREVVQPRIRVARDGNEVRGVRASFFSESAEVVLACHGEHVRVFIQSTTSAPLTQCENIIWGADLQVPFVEGRVHVGRQVLVDTLRQRPPVRFCGRRWEPTAEDVAGVERFDALCSDVGGDE